MTQWHDKLQEAVAHAPVIPKSSVVQPVGSVEDHNDEPHDDDPVVAMSPLERHQIPVYTPEDLVALEAAGGELGLWTPIDEAQVVGDFVHEMRHRRAAERVGYGIMQMTESVYRYDDGTYGRAPSLALHEYYTTRLGRALILAHPKDPSQTDMQGIEALGYPRDLSLLAQKAHARDMPIPQSVDR